MEGNVSMGAARRSRLLKRSDNGEAARRGQPGGTAFPKAFAGLRDYFWSQCRSLLRL
jgi:hypothetical protein